MASGRVLKPRRYSGGAKGEEFMIGLIGIIHADVEMQLLGIRRIRPAWRDPVGDLLESQLAEAGSRLLFSPSVRSPPTACQQADGK